MNAWVGYAIETLILTAGIFFFLRIVRTARGSRIIRGLLVAFVVGFLGLYGLAQALELEELQQIIKSVSGFVVVILAILFHPEIRRAIAQLGERGLLNRLMPKLGHDVVEEVCQAAAAMAKKRHGALIAFERENPLDSYVEGGVRVDSRVNRLLLQTIFQPGCPLHDGAVVIRQDRIAAAACLFPLTENIAIARSTGTRHRAALGLTDETDAVTLAVSEETGGISICKRGRMQARIAPAQLEHALREAIGREKAARAEEERGFGAQVVEFVKGDLLWLTVSLVMAVGVLVLANQAITHERDWNLSVVAAARDSSYTPRDGQLVVVLPSEDFKLTTRPGENQSVAVKVRGTRGQIDSVLTRFCGVIELRPPIESSMQLRIDDVDWLKTLPGMSIGWTGQAPMLRIDRFDERTFDLGPENVVIDGQLDPRYQALEPRFDPPNVAVVGPVDELDELGTEELPLLLEPITLTRRDRVEWRDDRRLTQELRNRGFALAAGRVRVTIPIVAAELELEPVEVEVVLACLDPTRKDELARWRVPTQAQRARLKITTTGLFSANADPKSQAVLSQKAAIRDFVQKYVRVFVDIGRLPPEGEGQIVPVLVHGAEEWREKLELPLVDLDSLGPREGLEIELASDAEIRLERVDE